MTAGAGAPPVTPGLPDHDRSQARLVVVAAVLLAFVVRAAWAWWATRTPLGANDPVTYLGLAERVADGQGYVGPTGTPTAYFPPGWPVALGAVFRLASALGIEGSRPQLAAAFNVVLGTGVVALLALLARRLFGWTVAAVTAVVLALLPSLVGFSSLALSEPLFLFLVALALLLALWVPFSQLATAGAQGWARLAGASVAMGLALLVRPVGVLLVAALLVGILVAGAAARAWRPALVRCALVVGLVALVLVPWAVRNASAVGAGLTLSTNTGDNLCIGNNPSANGTFQVPDYCFADLPDQDGPADVAEVARAEVTQQRAIDWIRANPMEQPRLLVQRTIATFQYGHYFRFSAQSYGADDWIAERTVVMLDAVGDAGWFAVIALGLCGVPVLWGRRDPRRLVLLGSIVGLALASWPFFGVPRFGLPSVVLLAIPAAVVLAGLPHTWARSRPDGPPQAPSAPRGPQQLVGEEPLGDGAPRVTGDVDPVGA